jgi:hypothetical protein
MDTLTYWAAAPAEELPARVQEKAAEYYESLNADGRLALMQNAYRHYYGLDAKGRHASAKATKDGKQGEFVGVKAAHYRNLAQHIINLTTQSRATWEPQSRNTDSKSQTATILAGQILDADMRDKGIGQLMRRAVEYAVALCAEAYIETDWDDQAGEIFSLGPNGPVKTGAIDCRVYHAVDVIREFYQDEDARPDWLITRRKVSRHRLAALYPQMAEAILDLPEEKPHGQNDIDDIMIPTTPSTTDRVTIYKLWHERCPHMPAGRRTLIAGDLVLEDGSLDVQQPPDPLTGEVRTKPLKRIPVRRITTDQQVKTPYGYTSLYDLMAINDVIDMLYSSLTTNNNAGAINSVWTPTPVAVHDLGDGLRNIVSAQEPKPINMVNSPAESYKFLEMLERLCETLSGVNSVARGNPEGELKGASGAAMALLQSMTIQFNSGLQQSYADLLEGVGDDIIATYRCKATMPQMAMVAGEHNRSYVKDFIGADLDPVDRVFVNMGNPAAKTPAGRLQLAENMADREYLKGADEYIEVVTTGRIEPALESAQSRKLLIRSENEKLKNGEPVRPLISDLHHEHIPEHLSLLDDADTRADEGLTETVLAHVQEHLDMWPTVPPGMAMLLGIPPPPMPAMPPPPPGEEGAPPPEGGGGGGGAPADQPERAPGPPAEGPQPSAGPMPSMPVDPMTGEQVPAPEAVPA